MVKSMAIPCTNKPLCIAGYEEDGQWELKSTSCFDNRMIDTGENSQSKISVSFLSKPIHTVYLISTA